MNARVERHRKRFSRSLQLLFAIGLQVTAFGQQPWPAHAAEATFMPLQTASLPEALRGALLMQDEFSQGKNRLPESLSTARIDLNADRVDEFIVESSQSYSGGPRFYVFERRGSTFVRIADSQGTIYFGPRVNGYFEIVSQSRAGGGEYTRALQRYEGDRYHTIRVADYRQVQPGGGLEFVRERSAQTGFR
jgi:hypothetical protein